MNGKFGINPDVTGKLPYLKEDGAVGYELGEEETRDPVYTPMAAFITAYARDDIVRNAQALGDRFAYADTDSLHVIGTDPVPALDCHPTHLGAWKHEADFARARYVRAKTYLEEVTAVGKMIDGEYKMVGVEPYLDVKCAGCPADLREQITFGNFRRGLTLWGKLRPRHVMGGIVLEPGPYTIK